MKRKVLIAVVGAMSILLAACGGGGNDSTQQEQATNTQQEDNSNEKIGGVFDVKEDEEQEQDKNFIVCFLQALFGQSCKIFLDIVACPNWTKLQRGDWIQPPAIADII